ncbi:serine--tRNA ligase [Erysipelothrix urinaevulpis]|uniref:serine--tRNA ligase n=1 Tax=Erysipelothrix urinaevulpis TaxID=2683717 RepID=UPI0013578389|nr:serine--tRNA ligase [Erysipelothrix urinaevulpis]
MLDIQLFRDNPEIIKENLKKKFQEEKIDSVDEIRELDTKYRELKTRADYLRGQRNSLSKEIGTLMREKKLDEANEVKQKVQDFADELKRIEEAEDPLFEQIQTLMKNIPNLIADDVPIGVDDTENVELYRVGSYEEKGYEIPYHVDIMESFEGIDLDSARKVSGAGFYYLQKEIARLHSAVTTYARDFMIDKGYDYVIPPFMIHSNVVEGVMSFEEMENMMYKIEGEDLYLIGTSEHSMIGKYIDTIVDGNDLPHKLTSYSPCFRKEVGAHGIEERGVYRIHQFEKQEMVIVCHPDDSTRYFEELYKNTVEFFETLDIPVRVLECCSGDLADLKHKSVDVEAWSPRQNKFFEVGSCSNLTDAQARRLKIRIKTDDGNIYAHTLNNTVVAPPRMLIAFLENHLLENGNINIPKPLQPYMGFKEEIIKRK